MSFTKKIDIQDLLLLICSLKKEFFKHSFLFLLISFMNGILMVCLNKKSLIKWVTCLWLVLLIKITMILINLKLLIYLLLDFLVLFVDDGIYISHKTPKILLEMLLKGMMKVFLFLMKVLVAVSLIVWILWSIPFSNILLVPHLIFHLEFLICWIIWDVLLCLITDGIKMFSFPEWCSGKIATNLIGKKGLLTVCLQSLLIR